MHETTRTRKIAIVGSGISGLSAAWLLHRQHDVTVFEQNHYVGGHCNTVDINIDGAQIGVDTGFIVYNPVNYPNLVALFDHLGVETKASSMSFAASLDDGALEYSGTNLSGLFSQRQNILRPRFLRMIADLLRFYRQASRLVDERAPDSGSLASLSLNDFLRREAYSDAFIFDHLMPMGAAIWSASIEDMLSFPTLAFLRFFKNHGLLQLADRPEWRTVCGGSGAYVERLTAGFAERIRCSDPVAKVRRDNGTVTVTTAAGQMVEFDEIIMACHADQALDMLVEPTAAERDTLGKIKYQPNHAVLHTDDRLMPARRRAWASWNYIGTRARGAGQSLCVTYWMNLLQGLPTSTPVFVTLNPNKAIEPKKILRTFDYEHPVFDAAALNAQRRLWDLQGRRNTWFCGAYFGSGFHEDGIQAGLAVAEKIGHAQRPWDLADPSGRIGLPKSQRRPALEPAMA